MIISMEWIKEFVDLPDLPAEDIAQKFTLSTCEVEEVIKTGELLKNVIIVEILAVNKHPQADKLHLVSFNTGNKKLEVVCGAPNVAPGLKVPFAPVGTCFPNGLCLESKKIRGIMSSGMLCSGLELGLNEDGSGLMVLPDDATVGTTMVDYLGYGQDVLLDIDNKSITHRPDLWGHYGMAREFATIFDQSLKDPYSIEWQKNLEKKFTNEPSPVIPVVDSDSSCRVFNGLTVKNVTVEDSPAWVQKRLIDCGLRPINNIVDISNYVMLELGMPNHIYDLNRIEDKKIIIKRITENKEFVTLDEEVRELMVGDTVVSDAQKSLGIGGIMGGMYSGVSDYTKDVFLEVANWVDHEIRKTSTRLGLRTDASQRYEKSLDSRLCKKAIFRLLDLLLQVCPEARVVGRLEVDGPDTGENSQPLTIDVTSEYISNSLGKELEAGQIASILRTLDFKVHNENGLLKITVPSYRATKDIECDADIVEEIGRIIGYSNITPQSPQWNVTAVRLSPAKTMQRKVQDFMVCHAGALEILTYPMVGVKLLKKSGWDTLNQELILKNALSKDQDRMRPSMVPSLLEAASLNQKHHHRFSMFELGRSYLPHPQDFSQERYHLAGAYYNRESSRYMEVVNHTEALLRFLKIPGKIVDHSADNPLAPPDWAGYHPYQSQDIFLMGKNQGFVTTVHPLICREFKIKGYLTLVVLDLSDVQNRVPKDKTRFKSLPRFPRSTFDCTIITETHTPVQSVLDVFKKLKIMQIESVKVADVFVINEDQKSVTLRTTLFDEEKTLSGEFIKQVEDTIVKNLIDSGYPLKS